METNLALAQFNELATDVQHALDIIASGRIQLAKQILETALVKATQAEIKPSR